MIHIVRNGYAICGKPGRPGSWDPRHSFIAPTDEELKDPAIMHRVSCPDCLRGGPPVKPKCRQCGGKGWLYDADDASPGVPCGCQDRRR